MIVQSGELSKSGKILRNCSIQEVAPKHPRRSTNFFGTTNSERMARMSFKCRRQDKGAREREIVQCLQFGELRQTLRNRSFEERVQFSVNRE